MISVANRFNTTRVSKRTFSQPSDHVGSVSPNFSHHINRDRLVLLSSVSRIYTPYVLLYMTHTHFISVIHMEQSQEANLFNTLHTEYSQDEMNSAFQTIEKFQYMHPTESIEERACVYALEKVKHSEVGSTVDHARRRIVYWYQKLVHFHQFGLLPEKYFTVFPGPGMHFDVRRRDDTPG